MNTKPSSPLAKEAVTLIKPSKTEPRAEIKAAQTKKDVISVVEVKSSGPAADPSKVEVRSSASKVAPSVLSANGVVINVAPAESTTKVEIVAPTKPLPQNVITKVEVVTGQLHPSPSPSELREISSHVVVREESTSTSHLQPSIAVSSVVEVQIDDEPAVIVGNNIGEPEYDFLSRQPSEFIEETYKVVNLKPSSKFRLKPRPTVETKNKPTAKRGDVAHPTGLVTKLGGTVVKNGVTTVHETSVIGTYISGKYAQVLQSTSHVYNAHGRPKINPTPTLRILKTAAPQLGKSAKHNRHLEPTPAASINEETALAAENHHHAKSTRKSSSGGSHKRYKSRQREQDIEDNETREREHHGNKKKSRSRTSQSSRRYVST